MDFYAALGPTGLADIAPPLTASDRRWLLALLRGRTRVLDAGCGYGRVAIPLAEAGFAVHGTDLSPGLIAEARRRARGRGLPLRFSVGDIREPLADRPRFDAVLCLWSTFQHLLTRRDRKRCLDAFHRVLLPGGLLVLEMTDAGEPSLARRLQREGRGPDRRIASWRIHGADIRCYLNDRASLDGILADSAFASHRVSLRRCGLVSRVVGLAWKSSP